MSRIHAKPYIRKVIDSLSDLQKVALLGLVNGETPIGGSANPTPKSLLNPSQYINGSDKNVVKYVALETAEGTYTGFLIYTNAYCCLVAYQDDSQNLDILDIDLSNMTYKVNGENTSIADMRFEIEQSKEKMDVVAYIEEAIQEGDIAIDAANVISLENVDLSEGSDEAVLSAANWILATDRDHECVLNLYLASQNVYPIGDVVELNRITVSDDEVTFGGTFDYPNSGTYIGYTISAVFTEQSGSIHITEIHNDIVTITATGVQSDEMAAKIQNAKALYYSERLYAKVAEGAVIGFKAFEQDNGIDTNYNLNFTVSSKTLSYSVSPYYRVASVDGKNGDITTDASFEVNSSKVAKLTGKLPYLTTLPSTDNTSGFITIVKCTSEPATRYDGYLYIVTSA